MDLTGHTFERLTVIEKSAKVGKGYKPYWTCRCLCGTVKDIAEGSLIKELTRSCGCYSREVASSRSLTHGESRDRSSVYQVWIGMKGRCRNPKDKKYPRYGGRGITVCARWDDFANFRDDMGERPSLDHSIDRIDNNGNYCPENCRWATAREQQRNRSTNHNLEVDGVTRTLSEWSEIGGIRSPLIIYRLKHGWSASKAVSVPANPKKVNFRYRRGE
jgi:hypothetical protein